LEQNNKRKGGYAREHTTAERIKTKGSYEIEDLNQNKIK